MISLENNLIKLKTRKNIVEQYYFIECTRTLVNAILYSIYNLNYYLIAHRRYFKT